MSIDKPPYICELTKGQVMMVRNYPGDDWVPEVFQEYEKGDLWPFHGERDDWKHARSLTPAEAFGTSADV